jgi:hypothetical protein
LLLRKEVFLQAQTPAKAGLPRRCDRKDHEIVHIVFAHKRRLFPHPGIATAV